MNAKSSSTDNSKDDSSKPAPQKSPQGNNVLDDFTEANNNVNDSADKVETAGSISGQEKLKHIKDECLSMAKFFEWFYTQSHKSFIKVGTGYANISKLKKAISNLEDELEIQVKKFSKNKILSQTVIREVNYFHHLFLKITEPAYDNYNDISSEEIRHIRQEIGFLGITGSRLSMGFRKLADGAQHSFVGGPGNRWKRLKKIIETQFKLASQSLKVINKTKLFKVEEIVEELNAEIQQFSGQLLKVEDL